MYPDRLFTRRDIADLTGLHDDVLSFWSKRGLLQPVAGGGGAGQHRKFDFMAVQAAALLNELRRHGANIAALTGFAELLHRAAALGQRCGLSGRDLDAAADIARSVARFRDGAEIQVLDSTGKAFRPAQTESEVIESALRSGDPRDTPGALRIAESLTPADILPARLYRDLTSPDNFDRGPGSDGEWVWSVALAEDGTWHVSTGDDYNAGFPSELPTLNSYTVLRLSKIIRELWTRPA